MLGYCEDVDLLRVADAHLHCPSISKAADEQSTHRLSALGLPGAKLQHACLLFTVDGGTALPVLRGVDVLRATHFIDWSDRFVWILGRSKLLLKLVPIWGGAAVWEATSSQQNRKVLDSAGMLSTNIMKPQDRLACSLQTLVSSVRYLPHLDNICRQWPQLNQLTGVEGGLFRDAAQFWRLVLRHDLALFFVLMADNCAALIGPPLYLSPEEIWNAGPATQEIPRLKFLVTNRKEIAELVADGTLSRAQVLAASMRLSSRFSFEEGYVDSG
jgi:hypothetical protein